MTERAVEVRYEEGTCWITLNRPPHNILTIAVMRELAAALRAAAEDRTLRAIVLEARGRSFSAGVDVAEHTADKVHGMMEAFHDLCRTLAWLDVPTVASVQGPALGGGCEVVALCDVVVAAEEATFGQPEIRVGVFPPVAAAAFPFLFGKRGILPLLTGEILPARRAQELGLVTEVVPSEQLEETVRRLVGQLRAHSGAVLRLAKRAAVATFRRWFAEALQEAERLYLGELMATEDAHEGLRAFLEKRGASWRHR
ncbi:MAG: enoyl-CoA hydratase-related protein [Armatimonadota bacterium]|nr:enoyl-CoA hydratase-related protein [Armatimonadota bacterium]MDR7439443.1 enoyl-CoA hydratase-related protein [Armatimonadota bacterium]MDR7562914.1 enoyl-CoA hydratase-related protein [Armatimonadota bacterium]MDR7567700.1 enoyl-CoA hydratase-related protein [Armatimonadota bacterium]MDR7601448.1 enoyl-CoA hydratase-related protein [Armatimonadota bacterium]